MTTKDETQSSGSGLRGLGFFSESIEELKKVSTPTRQETMQATLVTIFIMVFVSLVLFAMDALFSTIMSVVISTEV